MLSVGRLNVFSRTIEDRQGPEGLTKEHVQLTLFGLGFLPT